MRKYLPFLLILSLFALVYYAGPRPDTLELNNKLKAIPTPLKSLDSLIATNEAQYELRAGNEAQIHWHQDSVHKTEWAIVYLHGFSASHPEGAPVHKQIAQKLKANLFLSRLSGHGYQKNCLEDFTAEAAWEDAKQALLIGRKLGKKVILMSTSTGGSFALNLAARFPDSVQALINLSPNIRIKDPAAQLLNGPWGLEIASLVIGDHRRIETVHPEQGKYWDTLYTVKALVELQRLCEESLTQETFTKISSPSLSLCYYKNEEEQDHIVSVEKIRWMHGSLGSPEEQKKLVELPTVGHHVLANPIHSKDPKAVEKAITAFLDETLGIL